jgi:hypothetical protein
LLGVSEEHGAKFAAELPQATLAMPSSVLAAVQLSQAKWMHWNFSSQSIHAEWATWPNIFVLTQALQRVQYND